jgi:predicted transcriptional regulator
LEEKIKAEIKRQILNYFQNDATLEQQMSGASGKTAKDIINLLTSKE